MIPSVLSHQLRLGVEDFLRTTFPVSTPAFRNVIDRLLDSGVFKGPYLSIQLPFRPGTIGPDFFPQVPMHYKPHLHQERAFQRLGGPKPVSTIVATGTGSGKTESFLLPILDHCLRNRGIPGVKAILIYPMNALASDQAGRIATLVHNNPALRGAVTAGLYVGQQETSPRKVMAADGIITDRETMRLTPPDLLVTNYKMLDYLLVRPRDRQLWTHNSDETLKYIAVDELHTFDGAQGTDLACLIRRLKDRLGIRSGHLCCIGTSATLGSGAEREALLEYARQIFGEPFETDAVISEERITAGEFLEKSLITHVDLVPPEQESALDPESYDDVDDYLRAQHRLWFDDEATSDDPEWRVKLGQRLQGHLLFQNVLKVLGGAATSYDNILSRLEQVTPGLRRGTRNYRALLLDSLAALVSAARSWAPDEAPPRRTVPFLNVRVQLWLRELRRLVATVGRPPVLCFAADFTEEQLKGHLPAVHCRGCGVMGWTGLQRRFDHKVTCDLDDYYQAFFRDDPNVTFYFPEDDSPTHETDGEHRHLCGACLALAPDSATPCPACNGTAMVRVFVPSTRTVGRSGRSVSLHNCPYCGARNGLTLIGSRAASLISVLVSQLFASRYNDDKKLLAFSDSVQDAAHRAGFFGARTFGFTLRTALLRLIHESGSGLPLDRLIDAFREHWLARLRPERFVATFLAPDLAWLHDYERMLETGEIPEGSKLLNRTHLRVGWEIASEFAFRSRLGRTLEKTGSAVAAPCLERLERAVTEVGERLRNEVGSLRNLDHTSVRRFVVGLMTRLKGLGAVLHPALDGYVETMGNTYVLTRIRWMRHFGPSTPAPSFLADRRSRRFDALPPSRRGRWYEDWAVKCFGDVAPMVANDAADVYEQALAGLVHAGLLEQRTAHGGRVWGIPLDALIVGTDVDAYACDRCEHASSQPAAERATWEGAPCLRGGCPGSVRRQAPRRDYYGRLYARGDLCRVFPAEHTGLLDREEREKLEARFKAPPDQAREGDPNLLSSTPTLEMGIDIGDLSSLILCSVPPAQANYVQRVGRAGRRDGNALNLTVANGRPHDLYFYAEPEEMIAGAVSPPGVFLDASAVLERQLTAYCLDRWVATGIGEEELPRQLGQVLTAVQKQDTTVFPYTLLRYVDANRTDILQRFLRLFEGRLTPESVAHMKVFLEGGQDDQGSLAWRIVDGLQGVSRERESLRKKARAVNDKLKRKEAEPAQDKHFLREIAELKREKSALRKLAADVSDRDTFNFLTDEGLIPNYAFPEAGVVLRSIIYRMKDTPDEGPRYQTRTYDFERPSARAIGELAPGSRFYALRRRVTVDQVDMGVSDVETWRFCNRCSHSERVDTGDERTVCIRCGSGFWADAGQKRPMLRLRQVFATTSDRRSRIGDESDDREPTFFNRQMLADFDPQHVEEAWRLDADDLPFGFELVGRATFREVNFGQKADDAEKVRIAGLELPRRGFRICRACGKIQLKRDKAEHALSCTARDQQSERGFVECVYLYRDFTSEAVRILLPVTTFSTSERLFHSFIAALHLGLRRHFSGRVDHLQTAEHEEPVPDSEYRKRYLLLYDTVPGGTGYLKQLMRTSEPLLEVLQKALDALKACPCNQDPERDGCYRCLFAYRHSRLLVETSREEAVALLSKILDRKDRLVRVEGLEQVQVNALFDSELEARFVEALRRANTPERPVTLAKEVLASGKAGYFLKVGERAWYVEPQASLGPADGVSVPCRTDFLFIPARDQDRAKRIAVFTDGFTHHRDRLGLDTAQRMAIHRSGRLRCWSLSWHDVVRHQAGWFHDYLADGFCAQPHALRPFLDDLGIQDMHRHRAADSFDWLIAWLERPNEEAWSRYAFVHAYLHLDVNVDRGAWRQALDQAVTEEMYEELFDIRDPYLHGWGRKDGATHWYVSIEHQALVERRIGGMQIACVLDDRPERREDTDFERSWNGFLRIMNLYQFLRRSWFLTASGRAAGAYAGVPEADAPHVVPMEQAVLSDAWQAVLTDCEPAAKGLSARLAEAGWAVPEVGFELQDPHGRIVATAELAWPDARIALLREDEMEYLGAFEGVGWRALPLAEGISDPDFQGLREPA